MAFTVDGSNGLTFPDSTNMASATALGMRNRIINGAMVIDQRNAGASVTITTSAYTLDRWQGGASQSSKYSVQQNAGSVTPPAGFINYLGVTSLSSYSVLSSDNFFIQQPIEGLNVADLAWGTASAKTVTLSFWVRSSLTGTFGGTLVNSANNYSYPFTFTINSANTWEYETITITGPTAGTWLTTNGVGLRVNFGLGCGSTNNGPAGSWAAANYTSATGSTSIVGTNGATFYITGVQLERGTQATPFEWRPYGTELSLCQRYYSKTFNTETAPVQNSNNFNSVLSTLTSSVAFTGNAVVNWRYPVQMRAVPTITLFTPGSNTSFIGCWTDSGGNYIAGSATNTGSAATFIYTSGGAASVNSFCYIHASASAEL